MLVGRPCYCGFPSEAIRLMEKFFWQLTLCDLCINIMLLYFFFSLFLCCVFNVLPLAIDIIFSYQ